MSQQVRKLKFFLFVGILLVAFFVVDSVKAEELNMSVKVLPRKITDTINDFDFFALSGNLIPAPKATVAAEVKGISTGESSNLFTKLLLGISHFFSKFF